MNEKYPLPEGWRWVMLEDACELIMGQSPPGSTYTDKPEGLPFFQGKADFGEYFPRVRVWCNQPIKIAEKGDILISVRAPVGPVNMNNLKCCIGRGLAAIRCRDNARNWFIFWYLRFKEAQIASIGSGSTFGAITRSDLINFQIPLPPIEEQHRIATKIQELMQEVERARSACEKQLEAAKALSAAHLREVFESEEAMKWERKRLGEVARYINGRAFNPTEWKQAGTPIIRIQNLNDPQAPFNYYDGGVEKRYRVSNGDLLISWSASLGVYFWKRGNAVLNQHIFRVEEFPELVKRDFLYFVVNYAMEEIKERIHGATMQHVTKPEFEAIAVSLPPLPEQKRIAAELKEKLAYVEKLRTSIEKQLEAINALPQSILRKAFKDEIC